MKKQKSQLWKYVIGIVVVIILITAFQFYTLTQTLKKYSATDFSNPITFCDDDLIITNIISDANKLHGYCWNPIYSSITSSTQLNVCDPIIYNKLITDLGNIQTQKDFICMYGI